MAYSVFTYRNWSGRGGLAGSLRAVLAASVSTLTGSACATPTPMPTCSAGASATTAVIAAARPIEAPAAQNQRRDRCGRSPRAAASSRSRAGARCSAGAKPTASARSRIRSSSSMTGGLLREVEGAELGADAGAGAAEPRFHGADGDAQRFGDFLVAQPFRGDEQQDVPLARAQRRQARVGVGARGWGADLLGARVGGAAVHGRRPDGWAELQLPPLRPPLPRDEVRGDAVEPRPRVRQGRVELRALGERDEEGVREDVVRRGRAQPPDEVAVDVPGMAGENGREQGR